jgi:hypothetical protein
MPYITYTAQGKPNRWSHVPELLLGYGTGLIAACCFVFLQRINRCIPDPSWAYYLLLQ